MFIYLFGESRCLTWLSRRLCCLLVSIFMSTYATHSYPPFLIICHHYYSLCTFAPRVSLSYNEPAFNGSRATHYRLSYLHLAHPWYRPNVNLIHTIHCHTFEILRAGLSFYLLGSSPRHLFVFNHWCWRDNETFINHHTLMHRYISRVRYLPGIPSARTRHTPLIHTY